MDMALHVASWSKDTSSQVGVVIVGDHQRLLSIGYNGLPRGCNDDPKMNPGRHESGNPEKYLWYEHAERNAIYNAAAEGIALRDATMYAPNAACCDCARAVVQSGIKRFIYYNDGPFFERQDWVDRLNIALRIFSESRVAAAGIPGFPRTGLRLA
jgi:dCMP deaminase